MRRPYYEEEIDAEFEVHPVCALLGPRQVGKTTLARMYIEAKNGSRVQYFDLENPLHLARLENPMLTLSELSDQLIVIDEIQRRPDLFEVLRVLVDEPEAKRQFLVLGSASRDLIRQSSETLAGRVGYVEMMPFSLEETDDLSQLWLRGGFPRSFLAKNDDQSYRWRTRFITTFLERDVPNLGFSIPAQQMRRFWMMLVHYHGQIFNASELARSLGVSDTTVRRHLEILTGTFMVRMLQPWFENLNKRQVKSPKIYFRDSGLLHALVGLRTHREIQSYPKLGAFWEGFALEETLRQIHVTPEECYFWRTQTGAELDLLVVRDGMKHGFEFKYTDSPKVTRSMRVAKEDLKLDHLYLIFPGNVSFPLDDGMTAVGLDRSQADIR